VGSAADDYVGFTHIPGGLLLALSSHQVRSVVGKMIVFTLILLAFMEVSLSFDNAVLNAKILQGMSAKWQRRFLTWGIVIAVFGMRLVFPVLIVTIAASLPVIDVINMALNSPEEYGRHLEESRINVSTFGGIFLLMVFLSFWFDNERETHWLHWIESRLSTLGLLKGVEIIVAGAVLVGIQYFIPTLQGRMTCLLSGLLGIGTYMLIEAFTGLFDTDGGCENKRGLMGLLYLEVLDASCSLDGVIGAFALTTNIVLIMIGLGMGAFVIRSLTLYLVRGGTLKEYIYLEHGAHYGIGALAVIMLANIFYPVPEPITGMIGLSCIALSLISSIRHRHV